MGGIWFGWNPSNRDNYLHLDNYAGISVWKKIWLSLLIEHSGYSMNHGLKPNSSSTRQFVFVPPFVNYLEILFFDFALLIVKRNGSDAHFGPWKIGKDGLIIRNPVFRVENRRDFRFWALSPKIIEQF